MFRMAFVNAVGLCHSIGLAYFGIFDGHPWWTVGKMARLASLLLDFGYRISLCFWYHRNSYCCLLPKIMQLFSLILYYCQLVMLRVRLHPTAILNFVWRFIHEQRNNGLVHSQLVMLRVRLYLTAILNFVQTFIYKRRNIGLVQEPVQETYPVLEDQNDYASELVINGRSPYNYLLSRRYKDTTCLLKPPLVKNTFLAFPPLQVTNTSLRPDLVGEVNTNLILQDDKSVYAVR